MNNWISVKKQLPIQGQLVIALIDNRKNFQACVLADMYKYSKLSTIPVIYGGVGDEGQPIWAHLFPRANNLVSDADRITMWTSLPELPIALLNSTEYHEEHQLSQTDIVGYGL